MDLKVRVDILREAGQITEEVYNLILRSNRIF